MDYMYYRNLVDVCFTEDEAKAEAEEVRDRAPVHKFSWANNPNVVILYQK